MFRALARRLAPARRVREASARFRSRPDPEGAAALVAAHLEAGDPESAWKAAVLGRDRFPDAGLVREAWERAARARGAREIESLRRRVARRPRPELLARLAEVHRFLGDPERAIETAHRAIQRFPDHPAGHVALARIHYGRFLRTAAAGDGRAAQRELERARALAPGDPRVLLPLAALYARIGTVEAARRLLETLREAGGDDPRAETVARTLERIEPFDALRHADPFHTYEASHADRPGRRAAAPRPEWLAPRLRPLLEARGVASVVALGPDGACLFAHPDAARERAEALRAILGAARTGARRMSLGVFGLAIITEPEGKLVVAERGAVTIVVCGDRASVSDAFHQRVDELVGSCLEPEEIPCESFSTT